MDPTAFSNTSTPGEVREGRTGSSTACPPTIISSLRQLQSVTEGGLARRRRRRSYAASLGDMPSVYEKTWSSSYVRRNWATSTNARDTHTATSKGQQGIVPIATLRKIQRPALPGSEGAFLADVGSEGSQSFRRVHGSSTTEGNPSAPPESASRRRRTDSGPTEACFGIPAEKGTGKAYHMVEAPTRAPSQKSVGGRDALLNESCAAEGCHQVSATDGRRSQPRAEALRGTGRGCRTPAAEWEQRGKNGLEISEIKKGCPQAAVCGELDTGREASRRSFREARRSPDPAEAHLPVTPEHAQTAGKSLFLQRAGSWSTDCATPACQRGFSVAGGKPLHDTRTTVDRLMGRVLLPVTNEAKYRGGDELLLAGGEAVSEIKTAAFSNPGERKSQQHIAQPAEAREEGTMQKGLCGGDDEAHGKDSFHEQQKRKAALTRVEGQKLRIDDAEASKEDATSFESLTVLSFLRHRPGAAHGSQPLPRERFASPRRSLQTADNHSENGSCREQDTPSRTVLVSTQGPSSAFARETCGVDRGHEYADERRPWNLETDSEPDSSAPHKEVGAHEQTPLHKVSWSACDDAEEYRTVPNAAVPLSSATEDEDARDVPRSADTPGSCAPSESSPALLPAGFHPASVSLYYHVEEASPSSRKHLSMHNAVETTQQGNRLYPVVKGVSRDNAKRRWAVYWKGSRRYFYDKLNENCYHAYQQAVSFRIYSYIQHALQTRNVPAVQAAPDYDNDRCSLEEPESVSFDAAPPVEEGLTFKQTGSASLDGAVLSASQLSRESRISLPDFPGGSPAALKQGAVFARHAYRQASEDDAEVDAEAMPSSYVERADHFASKAGAGAPDDGAPAESPRARPPPREKLPADPVMNMYKTALVMVLQDLKASLSRTSASSAPLKSSTSVETHLKVFQDRGVQHTNGCAPACPRDGSSLNSQLLCSSEKAGAKNADSDTRWRPFLLLVVEWHLDAVTTASERRELQPLLGVFSPCFQHLLLPRDAPRPLQQKIYRELIKIHTSHAMCHLTSP